MKQILLSCCLVICSGCGISITTSGLRIGFIDTKVETGEDGSRVCVEDTTGLVINWLPYFTYHDLIWWKK